MADRYVLEGEWTGYRSSQQRVVHREVVIGKFAEQVRKLHSIQYTDGTSLIIRVRPANHREHVARLDSYGDLIRKAVAHGGSTVRVADLYPARPMAPAS